MIKKIVFQFVGEEVQNSLFFDAHFDAVAAFSGFTSSHSNTWIVKDAHNALGETFDIAYQKSLIKWVSLVDMNDKAERSTDLEILDDINKVMICTLENEVKDLKEEVNGLRVFITENQVECDYAVSKHEALSEEIDQLKTQLHRMRRAAGDAAKLLKGTSWQGQIEKILGVKVLTDE